MIAVDTNLLIYAHRRDSVWFEAARRCIRQLAESPAPWAIPWPCLHEFIGIVTHSRIFRPPSTLDEVVDQVEAWSASPSFSWLGEGVDHWSALRSALARSRVVGPKVHDARIATICVQHGVDVLWTADRDFSRFGAPRVRNPLVEPPGEVHERGARYGRRRARAR